MKQAEELRKISEANYHKVEVEVNETLADIYKKATKAAKKGYESIKYKVDDSMIFYMVITKLKKEGYKVIKNDDRHTLIIDWGKDFDEDKF